MNANPVVSPADARPVLETAPLRPGFHRDQLSRFGDAFWDLSPAVFRNNRYSERGMPAPGAGSSRPTASGTYQPAQPAQPGQSVMVGGQPRGELLGPGFNLAISQFRPEGTREFIPARTGNISRKEHLQGAFARLTTRTHKIQRMKDEG